MERNVRNVFCGVSLAFIVFFFSRAVRIDRSSLTFTSKSLISQLDTIFEICKYKNGNSARLLWVHKCQTQFMSLSVNSVQRLVRIPNVDSVPNELLIL